MEKLPNILILMCDQLNAGALGCYHGPVPTPNIDRLAAEGVLFNNATCPYPVCSPSRASLVTGVYPHMHGIVYNCMRYDYLLENAPVTEEGISGKDITTERILHSEGYQTHHYGKWHLLGEELPYYPDMYLEHHQYAADMRATFEQVRLRGDDRWMNWYGWALPVTVSAWHDFAVSSVRERWSHMPNYSQFIEKAGRLDLPVEDCFDYRVAEKTIHAIRECKGSPFMITCSFNNPHDPNVAPLPYYDLFDPAKIDLPAGELILEEQYQNDWSREIVKSLGEPSLRELLRIYYAQVKMVDDEVGKILDTLREESLERDTIVLFTADHGDMMGRHGMFWKSTSNFYDELVRVPFIIRFPAGVKSCTTEAAASLVDIMPTLLGMTGHPTPPQAQGKDLSPFLTGAGDWKDAPEFSFCERLPWPPGNTRESRSYSNGSYMVRGNGWKYIRYFKETSIITREYLYHLESDPGETKNLAGTDAYRHILSEMSARMEKWLRETCPGNTGAV